MENKKIKISDFVVTHEDLINDTQIVRLGCKVSEDYDNFIFETISPFCEQVLQKKISKEELKFMLLNFRRTEEENKKLIEKCNQLEDKARKLEHMVDKLLKWIKDNE